MLEAVVDTLACPHCGSGLTLDARTARCRDGHAFDLARQGHLNLLSRPGPSPGDTAEMVAARTEFLATGNYQPLVDALVEAVVPEDGLMVELGAGTGYYLRAVVDAGSRRTGLALDVSGYAARRAAKAHPRIGSVVADAWQRLPVRSGVADAVLDVFAPRNAAETARVLRPGGVLLVVTPNPPHLRELVSSLGLVTVDADKDRRLDATLGGHFARTGASELEWTMPLDRTAVRNLVAMGPSAWHTSPDALAVAIAELPDPVQVTASVTLSHWTVR